MLLYALVPVLCCPFRKQYHPGLMLLSVTQEEDPTQLPPSEPRPDHGRERYGIQLNLARACIKALALQSPLTDCHESLFKRFSPLQPGCNVGI